MMLGYVLRLFVRLACRTRLDEPTREAIAGARLIVANHPSVLDPVVVVTCPPIDAHVIVSRQAVRRWFCRVALEGCAAEVADLSEAQSVRRIARLIAQGRTVVVFPENRVPRAGAAMKIYEAPAMVAARSDVPVFTLHIRHGAATHDGVRRRG